MKARHFTRYLSDDGTTSGTKNANGNYSGAGDDEFYLLAATGETLEVHHLAISIEDTSGMQANEYGNIGSALGEGILIKVIDENGGVLADLTDSVAITTNAEWARLCHEVDVKSWGTTPTNELLVAHMNFHEWGDHITLDPGQKLVVYLRDSLVGLVSHYFIAEGLY